MPGDPNSWTYLKDGTDHIIEWGDGLLAIVEKTQTTEYVEETDHEGTTYWKTVQVHNNPQMAEISHRLAKIVEENAP